MRYRGLLDIGPTVVFIWATAGQRDDMLRIIPLTVPCLFIPTIYLFCPEIAHQSAVLPIVSDFNNLGEQFRITKNIRIMN